MVFCSGFQKALFRRLLVLVTGLIAGAFFSPFIALAEIVHSEVVAGEYIVKLPADVSGGRNLSAAAGRLGEVANVRQSLGAALLISTNSTSTHAAAATRPAFVPYDKSDRTCAELIAAGRVISCEPNFRVRASAVPDDPMYGSAWGLNGLQGIDAPRAWSKTTGSADLVVAIIDTGMDYNHPDLAANVWTNSGEIAGNGLDDDRNGYVDDVHGINTLQRGSSPLDDAGHGTHVAGIIGAVGNNRLGISGVAWKVRLMPLKFLDSSGSGSIAGAIEALNYAITMKNRGVNVRLSNNSWGGGGYSPALNEAVGRASQAGIVFVAAAGNESNDNDVVPSNPGSVDQPNVVSVAAIDPNQNLASFSNYGAATVDIAAPGVGILSTVPGGGFQQMSGTSMAAPFVSGALALLMAAEPQLNVEQVLGRLYESAVPVASLSGLVRTARVLNAGRLVTGENNPLPSPDPAPEACAYSIASTSAETDRSADEGTPLMDEADEFEYATVSLPFRFPFNGEYVTQVSASPNGVLYMGAAPAGMDYEAGQDAPSNSIAALHTDMVSTVRNYLGTESATFFWRSYLYSNRSAGYVEIRLTLAADGSIREWLSFSSGEIENLIRRKATIGIAGRSQSSIKTFANSENSSSISDGLALQYVPSCSSSGGSGEENQPQVQVKNLRLWGEQAGSRSALQKTLKPGKRFRLRVSATPAGAPSRAAQLDFYLGKRMCVETAQIELASGQSWLKGRLPRGLAGRFSSFKVKIENASAVGKIADNNGRARRASRRSLSSERFGELCRSIAASVGRLR